MLDLKRKVGESIVVSDNITITLKKINGDEAIIGIAAPKEVTIDRKEVHNRKRSQEK